MPFATPYAAIAGAMSLAALVALYLYRVRFRRRQVSSLMLWRFAKRAGEGGRRREFTPPPPIFYVELALLLVLAAAAATPLFRAGERPVAYIVLDVSASMSARSLGGRTPADRAESFLVSEFRRGAFGKMKVVAAPAGGPETFPTCAADAHALFSGKFGRFDSPGDSLPEAIAVAMRLASGAPVAVVTDKPRPPEMGDAPFDWLAFGEKVHNGAVSFASISRQGSSTNSPILLYAELRRFPPAPGPFEVRVAADVGRERLFMRETAMAGTGGIARLSMELPPACDGRVAVELGGIGDALAADDVAELLCRRPRPVRAALSFADARLGRTVRRALDAAGRDYVENGDAADLFMGDSPAAPPNAGVSVLFEKAESARLSSGPFLPSERFGYLEGLEFVGLTWPVGTNAPAGTPILFAGQSPVIAVSGPGGRTVRIAWHSAQDGFFMSPAWPGFVLNAMEKAAAAMAGAAEEAALSQPRRFPEDESDCTKAATEAYRGGTSTANASGMESASPILGALALAIAAIWAWAATRR